MPAVNLFSLDMGEQGAPKWFCIVEKIMSDIFLKNSFQRRRNNFPLAKILLNSIASFQTIHTMVLCYVSYL